LPLPGGRQRKKDRKIAKNAEKLHFSASIYYICTMFENPGGGKPLLPAADAHAINRKVNLRLFDRFAKFFATKKSQLFNHYLKQKLLILKYY